MSYSANILGLNISTPFPLEELYVPLLALVAFFACMLGIGQVYLAFVNRKRSKKD